MKNLFHVGPPFPLFPGWQRILHGAHNSPPFLSFRVGGHLGPVLLDVGSVILEISEQHIVLEEDGVVANVALCDLAQYFRPHCGMVSFVLLCESWFEPDHGAESLHRKRSFETEAMLHLNPILPQENSSAYICLDTE